jgi:hypothetical protein
VQLCRPEPLPDVDGRSGRYVRAAEVSDEGPEISGERRPTSDVQAGWTDARIRYGERVP